MKTLPFLWTFLTPLGCSADAPTTCAPGFTLGDDGLCYQDAPPGGDDTGAPTEDTASTSSTTDEPADVDDVLASLPRCRSEATGDGDLDLARGCAASVCAGDTFTEMVSLLGEPDVCVPITIELAGQRYGQLDCTWRNGVGSTFDDDDLDGVVQPGEAAVWLKVRAPYTGTTSDGLGLDDEIGCFLEHGDPDYVAFAREGRDWSVPFLSFGSFAIEDYEDNRTGLPSSDGAVEEITLYDL